MKKIILTTISILVIQIIFANKLSKKIYLQECEQKYDVNTTCPNGTPILVGTFTVTYDCATLEVINTDFWNARNTCSGVTQDFLMP